MATREEIIAKLKKLGVTDEQIAARLSPAQQAPAQEVQQPPPQQQAEERQQARQNIIDQLKAKGVTDEQFLQRGVSTAPTEQEQITQIQSFQSEQQAAQQQRADALRSVAESTPPLQAGLASTGRSFAKAERVISGVTGLRPAEDIASERALEQERFAALQEASPVSTITGGLVGDIAVGLPLGGPAGALVKKATGKFVGKKIAALTGAAVAGAIEETLVEGNPLLGAAFGAGGEVVLPLVGGFYS